MSHNAFSPFYETQFKLDKREQKIEKEVKQPPKNGLKSIAEAASEKPAHWRRSADI